MTDDTRLRSEIDSLVGVGLTEDEAYLIAKRRLGTSDGGDSTGRGGIGGALILALVSAVAVKTPLLFGVDMDRDDFFVPNLGLFAFVPLIVFFAWRRAVPIRTAVLMLGVPVLVLATAANAFAFAYLSQTSLLSAITTPVALWFVVGLAYVGGDWRDHERRMDFVRFSGEWVIYYVLIALGGGVLLALTIGAFSMLGLNAEGAVMAWVMLPGAMGAVIVAAWLVEAKQSVVENMAPVLTRIFTPLTSVMLLMLLGATVVVGRPETIDRNLLILVDVVLLLVLGLLLYAISARDPFARADAFDWMQLVLVVLALLVDGLMLSVMLTRIIDGGITPNKAFALGLNVIVLVNLLWSTRLLLSFVRGSKPFLALERWQTTYLPVFGLWAAFVALVFPPMFGFA